MTFKATVHILVSDQRIFVTTDMIAKMFLCV